MRAFVDSSILIESFKGNKEAQDLLIEASDRFILYKNSIVFSEVVYKTIGLYADKSPFTLKKQNKLEETLNNLYKHLQLLNIIRTLPLNREIEIKALEFMGKYNLLPNDALILATCKLHNIQTLLTMDRDFEKACEKEDIKLVDSIEKLKQKE